MTKEERCRKAVEYHATTLNCAQSVLAAFSDVIGMTEEQCCAIGSGLGRGMRYESTCGAVSAAIVILGILYPHTLANGMEGKDRSTRLTLEFQRRFSELFSHLDCRDLLLNETPHRTGITETLNVTARCDVYIASAVELLCDMLEELEKE